MSVPFPDVPKMSQCDTAYDKMIESENVFSEALESDPSLSDALNVGSCETSRKEDEFSICSGGSAFGMCMGGSVKGKEIDATTKGCESVAIQHSLTAGLNKSLNCTANNLSNQTRASGSTIQQLNVVVKSRKMKGNLKSKLTQTSSQDAKVIDFTSNEVQTEFDNTVKQTLNSFSELSQKQKSDSDFASGDSQKMLQENVNAAVASTGKTNTSGIIKQVILDVVTIQGQDIIYEFDEIEGDIDITALQESYTSMVIDSITKSIVEDVMKNSGLQEQVNSMKAAQESIKETQKEKNGQMTVGFVLLGLLFFCCIIFSLHRVGHQYVLPAYRCASFWVSIMLLLVLIFAFTDYYVVWGLAICLLFFVMIINLMPEQLKENEIMSFGNGSKYIFAPYLNAENRCARVEKGVKKNCWLLYKKGDVETVIDGPSFQDTPMQPVQQQNKKQVSRQQQQQASRQKQQKQASLQQNKQKQALLQRQQASRQKQQKQASLQQNKQKQASLQQNKQKKASLQQKQASLQQKQASLQRQQQQNQQKRQKQPQI
jgi:hypothetical protein